jgi:chemotaxis protein MotB
MSSHRPIIVIRKKAAHAVHHGGAWKVAYADFVTAMMSLFIVLWLMNTSTPVKKIIASYFRDPKSNSALTGNDHSGATDSLTWKKQDIQNIKAQISQAMHAQIQLKALQNHVNMIVTPEGLRIELLESAGGTFFDSGSSQLSQGGKEMLKLLAQQLGQVPNRITIEGYTDAKPYPGKDGYTNWDLSADRANAARRLMQASGLHADQVAEVRGYGDQNLRLPSKPFDPSNRRITIVVHYVTVPSSQPKAKTGAPVAPGKVAHPVLRAQPLKK